MSGPDGSAGGNYTVRCEEAMSESPSGGNVPTTCEAGSITVVGGAPTPTPTSTPVSATPTRKPSGGDDDGCEIVADAGGPWAWSMLAVAALLWYAAAARRGGASRR